MLYIKHYFGPKAINFGLADLEVYMPNDQF